MTKRSFGCQRLGFDRRLMVLPNRQQKDDAAIDYDYEHRCAEHDHDCGHEYEHDSDRSQPAGRASGGGGEFTFLRWG